MEKSGIIYFFSAFLGRHECAQNEIGTGIDPVGRSKVVMTNSSPSAENQKSTIGNALVKGAVWAIALRWGIRLIGMASTLIIARILTPADYGLIAMATLVTSLIETFVDVDATTALLRQPDADRDFIDSAWTLKFLQSIVVACAVAIGAPFAADYFREPRIAPILWIYTIIIVGGGLGSVGSILARKHYDFALEVKVSLIGRLSSFAATVTLALIYRNYWALVFGGIIGMVVGVTASYAMHPFRPRFTLVRVGELFGFSQWLLISGIGVFFARKLDGFLVGRVGSSADLGVYNLSSELGQMLPTELGAPLSRALLPILSTLHAEPLRMRQAVMKTTAAVNTLTLPVGIGLAMVAPLAVSTLLGPKWASAVPFLIFFSIIGAVRYLTGPYFALFMSLGHSRLLAAMSWFELFVFACMAAALWHLGVTGLVLARVGSTIVIVLTWIVLGHRHGLSFGIFLKSLLRPVLASSAMAGCLVLIPTGELPDIVALVVSVVLGGSVYVGLIWILWIKSGKPDGLEARIVERLRVLNIRARFSES